MDVSVIIVNYKTPQLVIDCVQSVAVQTHGINYEVIVVDNASKDDSIEVIKNALGDKITLIASSENLGFGKANNLGAKSAKGKYLFLLNSDTLLINNAISILFEYLENNKNVGVIGGNLFTPELMPNSSYCMKLDDLYTAKRDASWFEIIRKILSRRKIERIVDEKKRFKARLVQNFNFTDMPLKVGYIFGADMMIPRYLFELTGGFHPDFFMYAEEAELTWRISQKGFDIISLPTAKIIHLDGGTVNRNAQFNVNAYKMRMTGKLTYYKLRFGQLGVKIFHRYFCKKLQRTLLLAKLLHRFALEKSASTQLENFEQTYCEFIKKQNWENK